MYRYLVLTLVIFCVGITFFIYTNSDNNKSFIKNPIDKDKLRYQFFVDGVKNISSTTLDGNIDTMKDNIQKWINLLEAAKLRNTNVFVNEMINKNLMIGNNINHITQTLYCVEYIKNIASLYLNLIGNYNKLGQRFVLLNSAISNKLKDWIINEKTKSCYLDYINNIKTISDDLVWWYNQIIKTKWYIDEIVEENYNQQYCKDIYNRYNDLNDLSSELSWYIQTIDLVISRINSDKVEDNQTLCNFGTIVGMTGIESKIYQINNNIKWTTGDNTIDDVQDYDQYIQKVKDKTEQYLDILNQVFKK